jgi:hypothetical protein
VNEAIARALWLVTNAVSHVRNRSEAREALEVLRSIVTTVDTINTWLREPGRKIEIDTLTPRVTISWSTSIPTYRRTVSSAHSLLSALEAMARDVQKDKV